MFRVFGGVLRNLSRCMQKKILINGNYSLPLLKHQGKQLSSSRNYSLIYYQDPSKTLLKNLKVQQISNNVTRSVTKYSWISGKRKAVKSVVRSFYRLHWGGWIRTKAGRHKKLWKKTSKRKRRLRQHVFCNATQCTLLDKMVTNFWRKPKYYIDDPYAPYHTREEFKYTYKIPKPYFPKEESQ